MTRRRILLVIVGLLSVANVGIFYWRDASAAKPQQPPSPTDAQLAQFQAKADQACKCVRNLGDKTTGSNYDDCWNDYRQAVAPFKPEGMGTMCAYGANYWDYFPPFDEHGLSDKVVTRSWGVGACSAEEEAARLAEEAAEARRKSEPPPSCG